jgi:DASS family divalent anion:Na+ symporter
LIYLGIAYGVPRPEAIQPAGWRLFALFAATVAGLIFQPIRGGALVLIAIVFSSLVGGLTLKQALDGYSDPTNWLVLAAFLISRSLLNTGLARRIALFFVRLFGKTSLGVSYALCCSDLVLATLIPSNGARSGGVILPIVRGVAELYGSKPGVTAPLIGAFLMTSVYQGICISSAMFLTGQASNPLAAQMASKISGVQIDWFGWFWAGVVPGVTSILLVPWIISKIYRPEILKTPEASSFARAELLKMGKLTRPEWILCGVFVGVCGGWTTTSLHHLDVAVPALLGVIALLVTGVLSWEDVRKDGNSYCVCQGSGGHADGMGLVSLAGDFVAGLLLCALRVCEHHGAYAGDVSGLCGGDRGARGTGWAYGFQLRDLHEFVGGVDQLWDDAVADVLRARIRRDEGLVARRVCMRVGQSGDLDDGRVCLVALYWALVRASSGITACLTRLRFQVQVACTLPSAD